MGQRGQLLDTQQGLSLDTEKERVWCADNASRNRCPQVSAGGWLDERADWILRVTATILQTTMDAQTVGARHYVTI